MALRLIIGNKNYSSWSFRPWIALKAAGIPFDETVIPLYVEGSPEEIRKHSPAGKVPILHDGDVSVWESLWRKPRNSVGCLGSSCLTRTVIRHAPVASTR